MLEDSEPQNSTKMLMDREYRLEREIKRSKKLITEVILAVYTADRPTGLLKELQEKLKRGLDESNKSPG